MTEPNDRKLAEDALALAEKATEGNWAAQPSIYASGDNGRFVINRLPTSHLDERLLAEMPYSAVRGKDAEENIANAKLMAASRQLVPDLAMRLLAALDRVDELERVVLAQMANEKLMGLYEDFDCPFCHHPVHHDLGCRYCNCKENRRGKDEFKNKVNKVGN